MPVTVPSIDVRFPPPGRRLAPICVLLSAVALGASLVLTGLPMAGSWHAAGPGMVPQNGLLSFFQQLLPLVAAALGLFCGALGLFAIPPASPPPADASAMVGLQAIVRQLTSVLDEEHGQIAAFKEIYGNSTREALVVSRRLALLADVALDAETRLVAGVGQAEAALRQQAGTGNRAADSSGRALPEIADLIRRGLADQSRAIAVSFDAATARLAAEADGPVQAFRSAVAGAAGQIKTLGETAVTLSRDVVAFDIAGRGIATASTTVVSRLNEAVGRVDAVLGQLPDAATTVVAAAEQVARNLAALSDVLRTDGAAFAMSTQQMQQATAVIEQEAEALRTTRQDITHASAAILSQIGDGVARVDAALGLLPAAVEAMITASEQTGHVVAEASRILCADSANLAASGQEAQNAAAALRHEAEALKAAGQEIAEAGHQTMATVTQTVDTAVVRLGAVIADADVARQGTTGLAELAATLESAASILVDGANNLDATGNRVAMAGEKITERFVAEAARNDGLLRALPNATTDMMAAMEALRSETSVLTTAAQQVSSAGLAATAAVTDVAARVETSAVSIDTTGRTINAACQEVAEQIGRLTLIAGYAETQVSLLPTFAADIAAAAARLQAVAEAWRPDAMMTILPEAAARLDAAAPKLDRLDGLNMRLENVLAGLEAGQAQEAALATMAVLSTDIGEAVRRVEAALANHEEAWPAVVASMAQVQATTGVAVHAAAIERASPGPDIISDGLPATLAVTLRYFDSVASQTELLLQQTEALAEAVFSGSAPNLPLLLADRAPGLLAGIEATAQRLRSVAAALTLASDGKPALGRRLS